MREQGQLEEWLQFFLVGVAEEATDAVSRAEALVDLRESYRQRLAGDRSRAGAVIDLVFQNPVLTTSRIARALDTSLQSALNLVRRLEAEDVVTEAQGIPGRSKRWVSTEVLMAIDPSATPTFTTEDDQ